MKKVLPCSLKARLLTLMLFMSMFTMNVFGQEVCTKSETLNPVTFEPAQFVCAGGNLFWRTTTFNGTAGEPIRWTIVGDLSGGAYFTNLANANLGTQTDDVLAGPSNGVLVHFGPLAGSVEVRMSYLNNPLATGCASSGTALKVVVTATPTVQKCYNDKGCINAVAKTILREGTAGVSLGTYHYTLNPGNIKNDTGNFCGLDPGDYNVSVENELGCGANSGNVKLVNPEQKPVFITCPVKEPKSACLYANADEINAELKAWLADYHTSGGTGVITVTTNPANPVAPALCGGEVAVTFHAEDECHQVAECTAIFKVLAPAKLEYGAPERKDIKACDVTTLDDLKAQLELFKKGFFFKGGCNPDLKLEVIGDLNTCGGDVTVNAVIKDKCIEDIHLSQVFSVGKAVQGTIVGNGDIEIPACAKAEDIAAKIKAFIDAVKAKDGCGKDLQVVVAPYEIPNNCKGGEVVVHFKAAQRCLGDLTLDEKIIIKPGTDFTVKCADGKDLGCLNKVCAAIDLPPAVDPQVEGNSCPVVITNVVGAPTLVEGCKYQIVRTYTIKNECFTHTCDQVFTYSFEAVAPVIVKGPIGKDLGCNAVGIPAQGEVEVKAPCGYTLEVKLDDIKDLPHCIRTQTREYVAVSPCGKRSLPWLEIYTWKEDKEAPVITCLADKTICAPFINKGYFCPPACDLFAVPNFDAPKVFDNCLNKCIALTAVDLVITKNADGTITYTKKWQAVDDCGNIGYGAQNITLKCCAPEPPKDCHTHCQHKGCKHECKGGHYGNGKHFCKEHDKDFDND
jgi:hypothetical protein